MTLLLYGSKSHALSVNGLNLHLRFREPTHEVHHTSIGLVFEFTKRMDNLIFYHYRSFVKYAL